MPITPLSPSVTPANPGHAKAAAPPQRSENAAPGQSVYVSLSQAGLQQSRATGRSQDIDDSGLPDSIKDLLKRIRELKEKLTEKTQELQQLMSDTSLSDEERALKARQLQAEVNGLNAMLSMAIRSLTKAIKDSKLTKEQSVTVAGLLGG